MSRRHELEIENLFLAVKNQTLFYLIIQFYLNFSRRFIEIT